MKPGYIDSETNRAWIVSYIHKLQPATQMTASTIDILQKLEQIEELARFALVHARAGSGKEHIKLIVSLAKYVATEIELIGWSGCAKDRRQGSRDRRQPHR